MNYLKYWGLSEKYYWRYIILINENAELNQGALMKKLTSHHPYFILQEVLNVKKSLTGLKIESNSFRIANYFDLNPDENAFVGSINILNKLCSYDNNLTTYFKNNTVPLQSTDIPLHYSRNAKLILNNGAPDLVVMKWEGSSLKNRQYNQSIFVFEVIDKIHFEGLYFKTDEHYAFYKTHNDHLWVFSNFHGNTLETILREKYISTSIRMKILYSLRKLFEEMINQGIFWGGFALRNMFLKDDHILLIDFEELFFIDESPEYIQTLILWYEIWCLDCLSEEEIYFLFNDIQLKLKFKKDYLTISDKFENMFFNRSKIMFSERKNLLIISKKLEMKHLIKNRVLNDGYLSGRQISNFWSDFLSVEDDFKIFQFITNCKLDDLTFSFMEICCCLEIFEAAMEADILDSMICKAKYSTRFKPTNTLKLIHFLEKTDRANFAKVRIMIKDWYDVYLKNPKQLMLKVFDNLN